MQMEEFRPLDECWPLHPPEPPNTFDPTKSAPEVERGPDVPLAISRASHRMPTWGRRRMLGLKREREFSSGQGLTAHGVRTLFKICCTLTVTKWPTFVSVFIIIVVVDGKILQFVFERGSGKQGGVILVLI